MFAPVLRFSGFRRPSIPVWTSFGHFSAYGSGQDASHDPSSSSMAPLPSFLDALKMGPESIGVLFAWLKMDGPVVLVYLVYSFARAICFQCFQASQPNRTPLPERPFQRVTAGQFIQGVREHSEREPWLQAKSSESDRLATRVLMFVWQVNMRVLKPTRDTPWFPCCHFV